MIDLCIQVGFGLYPVILKQFATEQKANPVIFSFYRQVLIHCTFVHRWLARQDHLVQYLAHYVLSVQEILVLLASQPPFGVSG